MKDEWKRYIDKLKLSTEFLHRDEFLKKLRTHPHEVKDARFPAIFLNIEGKIRLLVTHDEINRCTTLKDLMDLIDKKLWASIHNP